MGRGAILPSSSWRVPRSWAGAGDFGYAAAFGAALGPGLLTEVTFSGFYVLLVVCVLLGDTAVSAALFIVFALTRAIPTLAIGEAAPADGAGGLAFVARANGLLRDLASEGARVRAAVLVSVALLILLTAMQK
jgi:hypothetical protein